MSDKYPYSFVLTEALNAAAYRAGDNAHVDACMAIGGFHHFDPAKGYAVGPDGKRWRPGQPCGNPHRRASRAALQPDRPASPPRAKRRAFGPPVDRRIALLSLLVFKPRPTPELAKAMRLEMNQVGKSLRRAAEDGYIEVTSRGTGGEPNTYAITDKGRRRLASHREGGARG